MIGTARPCTTELSSPLNFAPYESPFGRIYAAMEGAALVTVSFCPSAAEFRSLLLQRFGPSLMLRPDSSQLRPFFTLLDRYFEGRAVDFNLPVRLFGTVFQRSVWKAISEIPRGEVSTYGSIASKTGRPRAYRAAAAACGRNMLPLIIPCHRVVSSAGGLGGWSGGGGISVKEGLLSLEGVRIKDLKSLIKA